MIVWGNFPRKFRRLYIAQNGICPYCGLKLQLIGGPHYGQRPMPGDQRPTRDHVRPYLGGRGQKAYLGNYVVCCSWCNFQKGSRAPHPCELLFAEITGDLLLALLPKHQRLNYLRNSETAKDASQHGKEVTR